MFILSTIVFAEAWLKLHFDLSFAGLLPGNLSFTTPDITKKATLG
jgi:hypothetical protein